ncbi:hypothetical protein ACFLYH_02815 [Candidatus Dependentiae bacterium]
MMQKKKLFFLIVLLVVTSGLLAIDNAHFYKSANLHKKSTVGWFDELEKYDTLDWFTKIDFNYLYGDSGSCWDKNGHSAPLLNSTGNYDMLYLMENVPVKPDFQHYATFLANAQIYHERTNSTFGQLKFDGKFELNEVNIDLRQNLVSGFFLEGHLPVRDVSLKNISYNDMSPETGIYNKNMAQWRQFKNQLDVILQNYGLNSATKKYSQTGLGDLSILVGWQGIKENKEDDTTRFLGLTLKGGILFPTGNKDKTDYVFSLPTGYNGHWGIPLAVEGEIGFLGWLTLSAHASAVFFFDDDNKTRRMKTFTKQQGYIKLLDGQAEEEKGTLWHIGADIKFDHLAKGLSFLVGYSYNRQEEDELDPKDTTHFIKSVVNSDPLLEAWYMHVLHFMLDYDFSVHMQDSKWAPRINVFYNYPFDGKRAFKTDTIGGGLGVDVRWKL